MCSDLDIRFFGIGLARLESFVRRMTDSGLNGHTKDLSPVQLFGEVVLSALKAEIVWRGLFVDYR